MVKLHKKILGSMKENQTDPLPKILVSPSVQLPTPPVTTTPKPPKIVIEITKNTNFYEFLPKSARFLQKNTKKYQFSTFFLSQMRPKPTNLRQIIIPYPMLFQSQPPSPNLKANLTKVPKYLYDSSLERFLDFPVCPRTRQNL